MVMVIVLYSEGKGDNGDCVGLSDGKGDGNGDCVIQ